MNAAYLPKNGDDEPDLRTQLNAVRAELQHALADRQRLAEAAAHDEQRRLAQMLHDTVSQSLTGVYLQAMVLARTLQQNGSDVSADVSGLADTLHQVVTELREVSRQLQPAGNSSPEP